MLHKAKTLKGYKLDSLDGEIGRVKDFYFDDRLWVIRYLVADTGSWLTGRQVLISPKALVAAIKEEHHIAVDLTKPQIESSPTLNSDQPVSRQHEQALHAYYGWPPYWSAGALYESPFVAGMPPLQATTPPVPSQKPSGDPNLRSMAHVTGYHLQATDGEIGHVEDFVIDDEVWVVRYLIVDTRNWWPGKKVLISPEWIERVSWGDAKCFVDLSRGSIEKAPPYQDEMLITRDLEAELYGHFGRGGYWTREPPTA